MGPLEPAAQVWTERGLPAGVPELLDLERQPWRTMEALACARIRLLAAQEKWNAADELALAVASTASERGLRRTQLRALALAMAVAQQNGEPDLAHARLVEFLRLKRGIGYVRPLLRERKISRAVLQPLLDTDVDPDTRETAEAVLAQLGRRARPALSPRERRRRQRPGMAGGIGPPGMRVTRRLCGGSSSLC